MLILRTVCLLMSLMNIINAGCDEDKDSTKGPVCRKDEDRQELSTCKNWDEDECDDDDCWDDEIPCFNCRKSSTGDGSLPLIDSVVIENVDSVCANKCFLKN